ncbi:MAG: Fe-S cluster assembly protein SufD [Pyrinomonadaceae bacterium]
MTQVKEKIEDQFVAAFRVGQMARGAEATWLTRLRESALDRFEQLGLPTVRDEEWKYTSPAQIAKTTYALATAPAIKRDLVEGYFYPEALESCLVFLNGVFNAEFSSLMGLPDGVVVMNLSTALANETQAAVIREHLARGADYNANAFNALNTAFAGDGAYVFIPRGVKVSTPLHLLFLTVPEASSVASFPRVLIIGEAQSEATVIESYAGTADGNYLTNAVTEVVLAEGARLSHYKVQNEGAGASHLATTIADLDRDSVYDATTITLGAQLSRHEIAVNLNREGAECWVDGLYIVGDGQHADTHSAIHHTKPHGTSHQLYKGILDGKSHAVFNGKVFVHQDAQQTDAKQTNRNLLLSNTARVDTKPQLEIFADDVKCAHGATVGQLEEEELFYLVSRGLHPELAKNLLTYGFAEEVIAKIKIESIKQQLDEAVLHRLRARLEA